MGIEHTRKSILNLFYLQKIRDSYRVTCYHAADLLNMSQQANIQKLVDERWSLGLAARPQGAISGAANYRQRMSDKFGKISHHPALPATRADGAAGTGALLAARSPAARRGCHPPGEAGFGHPGGALPIPAARSVGAVAGAGSGRRSYH
jgi:hypothetical protein